MPKTNDGEKTIIELLQKVLIVELAKAKVPQNEIKKIVGVGIDKVNSVVKLMKNKEE